MTTTAPLVPPLTPLVCERPAAVRVVLDAALIVVNRQALKQRVLDLIAEGKREFVIDFAECEYVDNSGLGVLVSCSKKIREAGGELVLEHVSEDLQVLFKITQLDTIFTIR